MLAFGTELRLLVAEDVVRIFILVKQKVIDTSWQKFFSRRLEENLSKFLW